MAEQLKKIQKAEIILCVEDLLGKIAKLIHLLEQEIEMIEEDDYQKISGLIEHKKQRVKEYENAVKALIMHESEIEDLPGQLKDKLKQAQKMLQDVMKINSMRVKARLDATQLIVETIIDSIEEAQNKDMSYLAPGGKKSISPVSYNQKH